MFLTIVDDHSRMTWIYLLKLKSDVVVVLRNFFQLVSTQFGKRVKVLRSDNGTEFVNSNFHDLFTSLGIIHQKSCVYTPQQNGVVERKHRYILELARAIRFQGSIPIKYWGHCVLGAVYMINRLPSTALHNKSPFEVFHGVKGSLTHLRTMGCLCYAKCLPPGDKFEAKAVPAVHMGYSDVTKGYVLYNLLTHSFFISRDVSFREDSFPFQTPSSSPTVFLDTSADFFDDTYINNPQMPPPPDDGPAIPDIIPDIVAGDIDIPDMHVVIEPRPLRQSHRARKHPSWMTDFVTNVASTSSLHPLS